MISNQNQQSVNKLHLLLIEIIKHPAPYVYAEDIILSLNSQGQLSKLSVPSGGIKGTSLNTLKRVADAAVSGGFQELNSLRRCALDAMTRIREQAGSPKGRRQVLEARIQHLHENQLQLLQDIHYLTQALYRAVALIREYAKACNDAAIIRGSELEIRELLGLFSLAKQPIAEATAYEGHSLRLIDSEGKSNGKHRRD